jgi:hypothetical protein
MPLIKKTEPLKERPVFIVIYGGPGLGKTSLGNTANNPILLDFDRGVDRSINRQDTLAPLDWEEVQREDQAGLFKNYSTVIIDTAKAALDDYLMTYVRRMDAKLVKNKLQAYGAIGDEFKVFVNNRRGEAGDIVIIAHSKEEKEGDLTKYWPDITGQSYQLVLRIADQVGFMYSENNKRMIRWDPTDATKGKNVARLPVTEIPDAGDPAFKTFLADLTERVRHALAAQSEAETEARNLAASFQEEIQKTQTPEDLTSLLERVQPLPPYLAVPLKKEIAAFGVSKGWVVNKELKRFELPPAAGSETKPAENDTTGQSNGTGSDGGVIFTSLDERTQELEKTGAQPESDGVAYGKDLKQFKSWAEVEKLSEDQFNALLKEARKYKPKASAAQ